MINNRQNGRRRGRGGQQARNGQPGTPDRGNRLDNRARGNAAQLLEKYKTLARDAQMQGDRVNTEYYLQFADHYFRVLSESRSRFEEQQQRRPRDDYADDDGNQQRGYQGDDNGDDGWDDNDGDRVDGQPEYRQAEYRQPEPRQQEARQPEPRQEQPQRQLRPRREDRAPYQGDANGEGGQQREPRRTDRDGNRSRGNGNGYERVPEFVADEAQPSRIEIDLPPSISAATESPAVDDGGEAAPKRRRPRRPRTEGAPVEA